MSMKLSNTKSAFSKHHHGVKYYNYYMENLLKVLMIISFLV